MKTKFIFFILAVVVLVGVLGMVGNKTKSPGKYDAFAQALKASGAEFYGAFWCPHCQSQKELFGNSAKYLPYVECSNSNKTQTQACIDKKITGYPTWYFKDGITVVTNTPDEKPIVCSPAPGIAGEDPMCEQISSPETKTYLFSTIRFPIRTSVDPVVEGSTWKFPSTATANGEVPLDFLAKQIGFTLPQ